MLAPNGKARRPCELTERIPNREKRPPHVSPRCSDAESIGSKVGPRKDGVGGQCVTLTFAVCERWELFQGEKVEGA